MDFQRETKRREAAILMAEIGTCLACWIGSKETSAAQQIAEISCETGRNEIMHHLVSHGWTGFWRDVVEYLESKGVIGFFFFF